MARWPCSGASVRSSKTVATSPCSFTTMRSVPSLTAMPAASCPRCCSANSPRKVRCATGWLGANTVREAPAAAASGPHELHPGHDEGEGDREEQRDLDAGAGERTTRRAAARGLLGAGDLDAADRDRGHGDRATEAGTREHHVVVARPDVAGHGERDVGARSGRTGCRVRGALADYRAVEAHGDLGAVGHAF